VQNEDSLPTFLEKCRATIILYMSSNFYIIMVRYKNGKILNCKYCNKKFYASLSVLRKGRQYCSQKCFKKDKPVWNKGLTKHNDSRMMTISKKATAQLHREYANGTRDKSAIIKKAIEARMKQGLKKFKTNPSFMINSEGYLKIYIPVLIGHGWQFYHHYVWEQAGKSIPNGYILHHINGNKVDNRIENLQLMNRSEHISLHSKGKKYVNGKREECKQNLP